jgi:hypothetical protein
MIHQFLKEREMKEGGNVKGWRPLVYSWPEALVAYIILFVPVAGTRENPALAVASCFLSSFLLYRVLFSSTS